MNVAPIVVAVSGGFDPIHIGHIRLLKNAKVLGNRLVVILNNDHWLMQKKQFVFIPHHERKEIIEALACVDEVMLTNHDSNTYDMSICTELAMLRPNIFANGGDRFAENIPEVATCNKIGCEMIFNVGAGGKVQSSSWLLEKFLSQQQSANL